MFGEGPADTMHLLPFITAAAVRSCDKSCGALMEQDAQSWRGGGIFPSVTRIKAKLLYSTAC